MCCLNVDNTYSLIILSMPSWQDRSWYRYRLSFKYMYKKRYVSFQESHSGKNCSYIPLRLNAHQNQKDKNLGIKIVQDRTGAIIKPL